MRSKFFYIIILGVIINTPVFTNVYGAYASDRQLLLAELIRPKPKITFYFGKRPPTCQGKFNICYAVLCRDSHMPGDYEAVAEAEVDETGRMLVLTIDMLSGITPYTIEECMGSGYFLMTEPYMIPPDLLQEVDLQGISVIPAGSHKVVTERGQVRILVNL